MEGCKNANYNILEKLGSGSYGTVYKATNTNGELVALKNVTIEVEDNGIPTTALREIALLKKLSIFNHDNIIKFIDVAFGQVCNRKIELYMVMEYCSGDLTSLMRAHPSGLRELEIRVIVREILRGLNVLHTNRIIHRDLKPQNILVSTTGQIKISDFGLAAIYDHSMSLSHHVVSLWYRAPEVLLNRTYDSKIDIWSVGCIIPELFSYKPLFNGSTEEEQINLILKKCLHAGSSSLTFIDVKDLNIPMDAIFLAINLLMMSAELRISAEQALQFSFVKF
ncbi:cyclin-dependent kinase 4 [Aethina tumida]|uniref:cyclin-dependent kinase 4 n=1 Tax=Aethina tumida TaxID=116153 RepID=UPI00096B558D|nr:cyclin-dependent kinase 4 [Aethina tumida]XP_049818026.1 cyclin-dependent kinase 4 [Aethina tumida]